MTIKPMFQRPAGSPAQPAQAPASAAAPAPVQPQQSSVSKGIVPQGLFAGISKAKRRQGGGKPWIQPGHYFVRIDQMKYGVSTNPKAPRCNYIIAEMTVMALLQDKEGSSIPVGGEMQAYYSDAKYPESFLADIKALLMAYFGMTDEQAENTPDDQWSDTIAEACQPEQILKGAVLELRVYMNRAQNFTKTEWVRRVFYPELDKVMPRDEVRARILPDDELQKQIAKEQEVA